MPALRLRWIVLGGAVLRFVAVAGITPTIYVDSNEYRGVALFGGNRRPWTVPLVHAVVGDGTARVLAHALLGVAAWAALAYAVAEVLRHRSVQVATVAAITALGLVGPIVNYDTTITSETVAISLAVLLLAGWLRLANRPTVGRAAAVLVVAVPFAFTRNDHPLLIVVMAVAALVLTFPRGDKAWGVVAVGLVVLSGWSWYAQSRNDEISRFNLALVVANRVLPSAESTAFFTDHGMPLPPGLLGGDKVLVLSEDRRWNQWARDDGRSTYIRWLLDGPERLILGPWPDLFGLRGTSLEDAEAPTVLLAPIDRYGRIHPVLPDAVESVLWGGGTAGPVVIATVGLAAVAFAAVASARRRGLRRRLDPTRTVAAVAFVLGCAHIWVVWHASPNELGRLAMVAATTIHASLLVLVAVTLDRRLAPD